MRVQKAEVGSILSDDKKTKGGKKPQHAAVVGRVVAPTRGPKGLPADVVGRVAMGPGKGEAHFIGRVVVPGKGNGGAGQGHFIGRVIAPGTPKPPSAVVVGRVAPGGDGKPGAIMVGRIVMNDGSKAPNGAHVVGRVMAPGGKKNEAQLVGRVMAPDNDITTGKGDKFTHVVGRSIPR